MHKRRHELLGGSIDKKRAHGLLTDSDRKRIMAVLPLPPDSDPKEILNRLARWIERYTLTGTLAVAMKYDEPEGKSLGQLESATTAFVDALKHLHPELKKRVYYALVPKADRHELNDEGVYDKGCRRYRRLVDKAELVFQQASKAKDHPDGVPPSPFFDFVEVVAEIWQDGTGKPFRKSSKKGRQGPQEFVQTVWDLAKDIAEREGRVIWTPSRTPNEGSLDYAIRRARRALKLPRHNRSDREKYSDRNRGRSN